MLIFSTEYVQLQTRRQRSYKNAPISFGISLHILHLNYRWTYLRGIW